MNDAPDRILVDWLIDGPDQPPRHGLERALAATRRTNQRPRWTYPGTWFTTTRGSAVPRLAIAAIVVLVSVTVALGFVARQGLVGSPFTPRSVAPLLSPSPSPSPPSPSPSARPSATPLPGYGSAPEGWRTNPPITPLDPLPDPPGSPLPSDLIGRLYNTHPSEIDGPQALVLTLRPADDPHCVAMFDGRSTCFTVLWTPNYPKHAVDPAVRGSARIVDGNLVLGFDLVPYDPSCEGTSSTYSLSPDGWTLTGIDVPSCSFRGFVRH